MALEERAVRRQHLPWLPLEQSGKAEQKTQDDGAENVCAWARTRAQPSALAPTLRCCPGGSAAARQRCGSSRRVASELSSRRAWRGVIYSPRSCRLDLARPLTAPCGSAAPGRSRSAAAACPGGILPPTSVLQEHRSTKSGLARPGSLLSPPKFVLQEGEGPVLALEEVFWKQLLSGSARFT